MPEWTTESIRAYGDVQVEVRREMMSRRPDRVVQCSIAGRMIYSERVDDSRWVGHCCGQLLVPAIVARACTGGAAMGPAATGDGA